MKNTIIKILILILFPIVGYSQIISTIAGTGVAGFGGDFGVATDALINFPLGVCSDATGNVYISDTDNNRVRKIDASTGIITTIAGTEIAGFSGDGGLAIDAQLYNPNGIFVDAMGNIYFADESNYRVRKITVSTGIINTIAGIGPSVFSGDGGLATNAALNRPTGVVLDSSGNVYIGDYGNDRIRKIDANTGIISTVAGNGTYGYSGDGGLATDAQLWNPRGVCLDSAGNIYFGDYANDRVRKVDAATKIISTIAGTGIGGYSGDGGLAVNAQLHSPFGVFVNAAGDLYIADYNNAVIRHVDGSTGIISTVAGSMPAGYYGDGGPATSAGLGSSATVFLDTSGNMYITDNFNNRIRKVTAALGTKDFIKEPTNVYPNPFTNVLQIESNICFKTMALYDVTGKQIINQDFVKELNTANLAKGFYFLKLMTDDGVVVVKKVVKE